MWFLIFVALAILIVATFVLRMSEVLSIAISVFFLALALYGALVSGEYFLAVGSMLVFVLTAKGSYVSIPNVHVGVPSSIFTGRVKRKPDTQGFSVPIRRPYKEGLHLKPFWWKVENFSTEAKELKFEEQEYQIASGGTIIISGRLQYRVSSLAAYRAAEVGEKEVRGGLNSEIDQFIIKRLGEIELEAADINDFEKVVQTGIELVIRTRAQISQLLQARFKSHYLDESETRRELFGRELFYTEHRYGVEVTTAMIDKVDPVKEIKEERDRIQKERYQKQSESIQIQHFLERVREVMDSFKAEGKEITPEKAVEIVNLNMKLVTKDIKEYQATGLEGVAGIVMDILTKNRN